MPAIMEPERSAVFRTRHVRKSRRFYLDDAASSDAPLAVLAGGHEYCSPGYATQRTADPCFSIELVVRGRGRLTLNGQSHPLDAGVVFSCGPGVAQHITTDSGDPLEKYFIEFTGSRALEMLAESRLVPGTAARVSSISELQDVFDNLVRDGMRESGLSQALCSVLWEYLMIKLSDFVMSPGTRPSPASATFNRCRQFIATHFRRLKSLEQIAEECEIDQAYLCRLFRRFDHQAPYRYLLRLKMNSAAEQLRNPRKLVKEVALAVGFEDPFHFSHVFKNVFGVSPDMFRRSPTP